MKFILYILIIIYPVYINKDPVVGNMHLIHSKTSFTPLKLQTSKYQLSLIYRHFETEMVRSFFMHF